MILELLRFSGGVELILSDYKGLRIIKEIYTADQWFDRLPAIRETMPSALWALLIYKGKVLV